MPRWPRRCDDGVRLLFLFVTCGRLPNEEQRGLQFWQLPALKRVAHPTQRRAQRSAAGQLLHTTQSSSGIGMAAACSPKVARPMAPVCPATAASEEG
jgi:hypothetical protein